MTTTVIVILAAGYPVALIGSLLVLLDYLRGREEMEREERNKLYTYIRTPDVQAVRQVEAEHEDVPAANPEDDRDYWAAKGIDVDRLPDLRASDN